MARYEAGQHFGAHTDYYEPEDFQEQPEVPLERGWIRVMSHECVEEMAIFFVSNVITTHILRWFILQKSFMVKLCKWFSIALLTLKLLGDTIVYPGISSHFHGHRTVYRASKSAWWYELKSILVKAFFF